MREGEFFTSYPDYHVRVINGSKTPASDPDKSRKNNLG